MFIVRIVMAFGLIAWLSNHSVDEWVSTAQTMVVAGARFTTWFIAWLPSSGLPGVAG